MLAHMQYRNFVWPNNPSRFEVEYRRTLHSYKLPFSGYVVQNLGLQNKIIRGEGEFVGATAYDNFRKLATLFEENKGGRLIHPVWPTMHAYFAKLNLRQEPKENYISYSFEFWEYKGSIFEDMADAMDDTDYSEINIDTLRTRYYATKDGDTLTSIATDKGLLATELLRLNAHVGSVTNIIPTGTLIRLR